MRVLVPGLLFLLPLLTAPAAAGADTIRHCTSAGCVVVADQDEDGSYDWANAALVVGEQAAVNANLNRTVLFVDAVAGTEETLDPYHAVQATVHANATDGFRGADLFLYAYEGEEETGQQSPIALLYAEVFDTGPLP